MVKVKGRGATERRAMKGRAVGKKGNTQEKENENEKAVEKKATERRGGGAARIPGTDNGKGKGGDREEHRG